MCRQHEVELIGELEGVREQFFAISAERKIKHPAVLAIASTARTGIFI
jgi:LysR family transcriptional activator of nhaA